jgi:cytochrome c5
VQSILEGKQTAGSPLAMPPKGGNPNLTEADARALVVFLRAEFGQ